jgi:hypothetical protein
LINSLLDSGKWKVSARALAESRLLTAGGPAQRREAAARVTQVFCVGAKLEERPRLPWSHVKNSVIVAGGFQVRVTLSLLPRSGSPRPPPDFPASHGVTVIRVTDRVVTTQDKLNRIHDHHRRHHNRRQPEWRRGAADSHRPRRTRTQSDSGLRRSHRDSLRVRRWLPGVRVTSPGPPTRTVRLRTRTRTRLSQAQALGCQ